MQVTDITFYLSNKIFKTFSNPNFILVSSDKMPQEVRVLRCCDCETFQSDIVKKVPKWTCKICNTKQSLMKVYFTGSGKECRQTTQELNYKRYEMKNKVSPSVSVTDETVLGDLAVDQEDSKSSPVELSKWEVYLPKENDSNDESNNIEVLLGLSNKNNEHLAQKAGNSADCIDLLFVEPQNPSRKLEIEEHFNVSLEIPSKKIKIGPPKVQEVKLNIFEDPDEDISHLLEL